MDSVILIPKKIELWSINPKRFTKLLMFMLFSDKSRVTTSFMAKIKKETKTFQLVLCTNHEALKLHCC
jgi:hypothetical protein